MESAYSLIDSLNGVTIAYFVFFVLSLVIGSYVAFKNSLSSRTVVFVLLCAAFSVLHLGELLFSWTNNKADAFRATTLKSVGFCLIWPLAMHLFVIILHGKTPRTWRFVLAAYYAYALICTASFFLGISHPADLIRSGTIWVDVPYWSTIGLGYLVMMPSAILVIFVLMLVIKYRARRDADVFKNRQINVMLFSGLPFALSGIFLNIVAPSLGIVVPSIGHLFIGVWILFIGYAITRYKFMVPTLAHASREILGIAGEIILITDMRLRITEHNGAFESRFGFSGISRPLREVFRGIGDIEGQMEGGVAESDCEATKADGSVLFARLKATVLRSGSIPIGLVCVISDVTELRNSNIDLEAKVAERTRLLAKAKEEAENRLRITQVYTRKSIVDMIERDLDPTRYQPNIRHIAVLFADIRDFTELSENLSPLDTVHMLNEYFNRMNACVLENGGEIDKLIGDCIMALFDRPEDSLRAAIAMRRALSELNEVGAAGVRLNNGIGINCGDVTMGNIGSNSKMDLTVIGDIVNSASRLESLTKVYGVSLIISEEFLKRIDPVHEVRFLDHVLVKGKKTPMKIYEIFDHDSAELRAKKRANAIELERAFAHYARGEFEEALSLYRGLASGGEPSAGDPLIGFYLARAESLGEQRRLGLLKSWNGIYEFMEK